MLRFLPILFFLPMLLNAQSATDVQMNGTGMRKAMDLPLGTSEIHLCNLTVGNHYTIIALQYNKDQESNVIVKSATEDMAAPDIMADTPGKTPSLNITATESCYTFLVEASSSIPVTSVPFFLSVRCTDCPEDNTWKEHFWQQVEVNLSTTGGVGASSLVTNTLIGGNCFDVSNPTSSGNSASRGTFNNGNSTIGIQTGVVLCTGNVNVLPGPNNSNSANGGFGNNTNPDDGDLATLSSGDQYDVSKLEFDFKPTASTLQFDFVFGSEEYCEYVNSSFNDVFGFFISGPGFGGPTNIALIPSTNTPVAINNVNHLTNSTFYVNNNNSGVGPGPSCATQPVYNSAECQLDGWTSVLTATANVTPCETYHIKLAIADIGDSQYASAVFLKANSFDAGGQAKAIAQYPNGAQYVIEDCGVAYIKFTRVSGNINEPLVINFTVDPNSTATAGVDYGTLTSPVTIPAGATEILIPVTVFPDLLVEGTESFFLTLDNPCSCTQQQIEFIIQDKPPLELQLDDVIHCGNNPVTLSPGITGGSSPFTYNWSTGATTSSINYNMPGTHTITVTVTDHCGTTATEEATVTITPTPTATLAGTGFFCQGVSGTVNLSVTMTGPGPWDVVMNGDTYTFTTSPGIIPVTGPGSYSLSSITSNGCPGTVSGSVNIVEYNVQISLTPNDPPCFGSPGSITTTVGGGGTPYTYSWNNGSSSANPNNLPPGNYAVTVTDSHGCTDTADATLTEPPQLTAAVNSSTNIDCNNPQGNADLEVGGGSPGYTYTWSNGSNAEDPTFTAGGTYTVTVRDAHNCSVTATVTIAANTTLPTAVIAPPQAINCTNPIVTINASGSSQGPNFTYEWGGPGFVCCETTLQPQVDQGGTYTLTVTNTTTGCTKTVSVTVTQSSTPPTLTLSPTDPPCFGTNGSVTSTISGQGAPFTYVWSNGPTTPNQNNLPPGTYSVTATGANGCTATESVTLTEPPQMAAAVVSSVNIDCNNPQGNADLDVSGGSPGYTFNWSNGSTAEDPTFNAGGTYTVTVRDAHNCSTTATVTIAANTTLPTAVIAPPQQVTCATPQLTLNATGSSQGADFTYAWDGPGFVCCETTLQPQIDQGGTYTLTVTNTVNGCTKTVSVNVVQNNTPPNLSLNATDPPCFGTNGSINTSVNGPGSPYTYAWSNGPTTPNQSNLPPGSYTVTVTGSNGCTATDGATLTEPPQLTAAVVSSVNIDCYNPQGSADLDVGGGSPGYTYNWSNGSSAEDPTFTAGGTYTVTVRDAHNCSTTATITIASNTTVPTAAIAPPQQITCATTQVTLNGTGSSTGPNFTYEWGGPSFVCCETTLQPVVDQGGTYTLTVTNTVNGCTKTVSVNVVENNTPPNVNINPPANIGCNTPTISLNGNGSSTGPGITYQWSTVDGNITSGATTLTPQVNQAGTYTLVVTNGNTGCVSQAEVTVTGNTTPPIATINPPGLVDCYNPVIELDASGSSQGSEFTYNWSASGGGSFSGGTNTTNPSINHGGTYTITVTNNDNHCTATASVTVQQNLTNPTAVVAPPGIIDCQHPTITLSGAGSSTGPNFNYEWTTGNGNILSGENTLNPEVNQPGTYTLLVTNTTNGCTKMVSVVVNQDANVPIADAGADNVVNCIHPTIQLNGVASTGPGYSFQWTANPGNFTAGQTTLHPTVNQAGTYTLVVTNSINGCTSEDVVEITANFDTPVAVVAPPAVLTCEFPEIEIDGSASTAGPEIQYQWTTTNGFIVSGANTSNPTVNDPGTYKLVITNTESGCTTTTQIVVTQNITPPVANAGPNGQLSCQTPTFTLNGNASSQGPNFTFIWDTFGGNILSGENTLTPIVDAAGTYTLIITNTTNGCTKSDDVVVTTDQNFPIANAGNDLELTCTSPIVTINGNGSSTGTGITYQWTANPGHIVSGATTKTPKVDEGGFYTLVLTNSTNGCTATDEVWVNDNIIYPQPLVAPPQELNCTFTTVTLDASGSTTSSSPDFQWTTTNGHFVSGSNSAMPDIDKPGVYHLLITNEDNGCTASTTVTVTQNITAPTAVAMNTGVLSCQFPQVELSGDGSSQGPEFFYQWNTGNGNIVTGELTLHPTISQPGLYTLTVFNNDNGCTKTANVTVVSSQAFPVADAGSPQNLTCAIAQITLNGNTSSQGAQYAYVWTTPNGNIVSGANTTTPLVNAAGDYDLVVVNLQNGCTAVSTVQVGTNYANPTAVAAPGGVLSCTVTTLTLDGTGSSTGPDFSYLWTTSGGNFVSGDSTLNPVINGVGQYNLLITNTVNGCTSTTSTSVTADASIPLASAGPPDTLTCTVILSTLNGSASSQGNQYTYVWTGPGIVNGINTLSPQVNLPGAYQLQITNTTNGCTAISAVNIEQDIALPLAEAGPTQELNCLVHQITIDGAANSSAGPLFVYNWTAANGGHIVSGDNTLSPVVDMPGTYNLSISNSFSGCVATDVVVITQDITLPVADAGAPGLITCTSPTSTLNGTGNTGAQYAYLWTTSNGNIASGDSTLIAVADAPGTYNLLITNLNNGCTATDAVVVSKDANVPNAATAVVGELNCSINQLQLSGAGTTQGAGITYTWSTTNGNIVSGANTLTPLIDAPGQYILKVFNANNNCEAQSSVTVNENLAPPQANAGQPAIISCLFPVVTLNGGNSSTGVQYTYLWSTIDGSIVNGATTLTPQVDEAGFYQIVVTDQSNGCTADASVQIVLDQNTPVAEPGPSPLLTCAVTSLQLNGTASSMGPTFSYTWTTIDGLITAGANTLTPTVAQPGTYQLSVLNSANGCLSSNAVLVNQNITLPIANAGASPTLTCANTTALLDGTGSSQGANFAYQWSTQNGQIVTGPTTINPTIGDPGTYSLLVTNTVTGCTQTTMVDVFEDVVAPLAAAAVAGELTCSVTALPLNGAGSSPGANFAYQWSTANGAIVTGDQTLTPTVDKPGLYNILVTNNTNGCTKTASVSVTQNITNPQADAGAGALLTCATTQLNLSGSGSGGVNGVSYNWAGPGIVSGGTTTTPLINVSGQYTITVTDLYNGCTKTDVVQVNQNTTPPTVVTAQAATLTCTVTSVPLNGIGSNNGAQYSILWTGPGIVSGANTLTPIVNLPGQYTLSITNISTGCTASNSTTVNQNVVLPVAEAGNGFELTCSILQGGLNAAGSSTGANYSYQWSTTNGYIVSGATSATPVVNEPGIYLLTVVNNSTNCTNTDQVQVLENTNYPSDLTLEKQNPACGGQPGALTFTEVQGGVGPYLYSIDGGNNFLSANQFGNITPGTYSLVVQDINGCEYEEQLNFPVPLEPQVTITPEVHLEFGESTTLTAVLNIPLSQVDTIIWSPMDGITLTNKPNVVIARPFKATQYTVTIINKDGCEDQAIVLIYVDDPHIWAPNVFSPNKNDGKNDFFLIFAGDNTVKQINTLQVFDRWGNEVFRNDNIQPNDEKLGWDGRFRGQAMNPAVFVWYAVVELIDGRKIVLKGDVTIVD